MTLKEIEKRTAALKARYPEPPTFEQFQSDWEHMDSLSRSLYECALACPELVGADGRYWEVVSGYLRQMGLAPEPFALDEILKKLESDAP